MADRTAISKAFEDLSAAIGYVVLVESESDLGTPQLRSGRLEAVQFTEASMLLTILGVEEEYSTSQGSVRVSVRLDNGSYFDESIGDRYRELFTGF